MRHDFGAQISARAFSRIGVKFRMHGRTAETGMDCIGLLADALAAVGYEAEMPANYPLRGRLESAAIAFFRHDDFKAIGADEMPVAGDFALVRTAPRQLHFIIHVLGGFVHAHAGLRRVVMTPGAVPWPVVGCWRYNGG